MDEQLYHDFLRVEQSHWWFQARREILFDVVERFLPSGKAFLDVGSGTGLFLEQLATKYQAFGLDASETAVRMCHERGLGSVILGTIDDARGAHGSAFDAVGFFDVIEHLDDDVAALTGARELLRPGGVVIVSVPAYMFLWSDHDALNQHRRRYIAAQLKDVLQRAGFEIELLTYFNSLLFPIAATHRIAKKIGGASNQSEFAPLPPSLNTLFRRIFALERGIVRRCGPRGMPFGLSILAVGRRPSLGVAAEPDGG